MTETKGSSNTLTQSHTDSSRPGVAYCCPDCRTPLNGLACPACKVTFDSKDGFPVLLSRDSRFQSGAKIGTVYDDIYTNRAGVWEDQGRTPEFIGFFSDLLASLSQERVLEVGCGEGFLLSSIRAQEKAAIDLSSEALRKASGRAQAQFCVALAERLPFEAESFDLATSVGVMEHFLDDREANREIFRVLRGGGHYVVLIHVHLTVKERFGQKMREYLFPRFRPFSLLKWLSTKVIQPISQPIQRPYTRQSAQDCLVECGFAIEEIVSTETRPGAPIVGPHVLTFIAQKR